MSATSKRRRRKSNPAGAAGAEGGAAPGPRPLAQWRWRTFPVFFALAGGLFVGMYLGIIATAVGGVASIVVFIAVASMLGLALSRFSTRWLLERNWIKPRPRR